ncbi:MAG TPA: MFS transporter [Kouleothrix sp.]|uniref:MFS transporter n=1 Tax=Kouleothrix sp. TaxID=2779161 RepID=UPI002C601E2E|nr:MFS transporter [Kouleothrix sp.]
MQQSSALGEAARRRGLIAILIDIFFMWGGFFMVVPLISVHFVDDLGWSAASIGLVLALRQLIQQGLTLPGGMLADRIGAKGLICVGMLIRCAGFAGMAWASSFPLLLGSAVLAAVGGALFESPRAAAIAALTTPENRGRYFSLQGIVSGLGMTLGPLLGALLLRFDFAVVALAAASCYIVTFLVTLLMLPPVQVATERRNLTYGVGLALRDRPFMIFNVLLMGYWFMWVQLSISLPLEARAVAGTSDAVSWVYTLNAGMSVLLQYPLLRLAERRLRPLPILLLGVAIMALGLGGVAFAGSTAALLLCVALFSAGALLAGPSQQTVAAEFANPVALGSYFGVNALALALGGSLGNYSGGLLYGLGRQYALPALPWFIFGAAGLATAVGMLLLHRWQGRAATVTVALDTAP